MLRDAELSVGLFPGQGGYRKGVLHEHWSRGEKTVRDVFASTDSAAERILGKSVSARIFADDPPSLEEFFAQDPDVLQVAIFGISVSLHRLLDGKGVSPSVLMGHSLGEIAALVCGGAFSLRDGAELVCHRSAAVAQTYENGLPTGGMTALSCKVETAGEILHLVETADAVLAVDNGPDQVVVSAPLSVLETIEAVASALKITSVRLLAPAAFHNAVVSRVGAELLHRIRGISQRPINTPVYSPILGRFYRNTDNLPELLALHLVTPVRYGPALQHLHTAGARIFVEVGAGSTLTALVSKTFPETNTLTLDRDLSGAALFLREPDEMLAHGHEIMTSDARSRSPEPALESPFDALCPAAPPSRDEVLAGVRTLYAQSLEYPEEVLTENAELEADLGIDSMKRTELLVRLMQRFDLDTSSDAIAFPSNGTVGTVADLVHGLLAERVSA